MGGSLLWLFVLPLMGVTVSNRGPLSVPEASLNIDGSVLLNSQSIYVGNATTASGCLEDCDCHVEGRCKPCSRFEMGQQVHECLRTGYRQWAYCSQEKVNKYVSCHYHMDPGKHKAFWAFQVMMLLLGTTSFLVVHWRQARMERLMAHRIEQQIRA